MADISKSFTYKTNLQRKTVTEINSSQLMITCKMKIDVSGMCNSSKSFNFGKCSLDKTCQNTVVTDVHSFGSSRQNEVFLSPLSILFQNSRPSSWKTLTHTIYHQKGSTDTSTKVWDSQIFLSKLLPRKDILRYEF